MDNDSVSKNIVSEAWLDSIKLTSDSIKSKVKKNTDLNDAELKLMTGIEKIRQCYDLL